jgi:hypothetical protein
MIIQKTKKFNSLTYILLFYLTLASACNKENKQYLVRNLNMLPVIDGVLDSCWLQIRKEPINGEMIGKYYWQGERDLSIYFRCAHDTKNLYFFIEVTDDICTIYSDSLIAWWQQENIEIFFANPNLKKPLTGIKENDISHFAFSYMNTRVKKFNANKIEPEFAFKKATNGYNFELKLPIVVGTFDGKTKKIGFNIELSDVDNSDQDKDSGIIKSRETTIIWTSEGGRQSAEATLHYGDLILTNK